MLKLFVLVEKLDRNVTIFFLQDGCATLVQGLDFVDDYFAKSARDTVMREFSPMLVSGEVTPPNQA